jgi:geranylgeranyl pyrophosphate synthase
MGKEVGDDLSEGKTTLPIIYALKNTTAKRNRKKQ